MPTKIKEIRLVGDFETTVYEGQTETEVWASAVVEIGTENVVVHNCIEDTFEYLMSLACTNSANLIVYYHNLRFDGTFWLYFLKENSLFSHGFDTEMNDFPLVKDQKEWTYTYAISDMGQWYSIRMKICGGYIIELRDSLKLLPFSVSRIGDSFGTKHRKLSIDYKQHRSAKEEITEEEKAYIKNDVLVVKEALEIMFSEGHTNLTIGSCCLAEYKALFPFLGDKEYYDTLFPDLFEIELPPEYGAKNADEYIRKSYKGGWCYVNERFANKVIEGGQTADVNSLYPSVMSSQSGCRYPVGKPKFWRGNFLPPQCYAFSEFKDDMYFFVRVKCRFHLKKGMLPTIQIKHSVMYRSNQWLETSDIYDKRTNKYYSQYIDWEGNVKDAIVELTLTKTDYQLLLNHYNCEIEILDGCYFYTEIGIFDTYIDKYKKIKMENKGAKRELAKLFLNNLYGKFATNKISDFKVLCPETLNYLKFYTVTAEKKKPGFIAIGSAITSYARNFTITAAQANYDRFLYSDTDSIHCIGYEPLENVPVDDKEFCHWKIESMWQKGIFVRQKTYIEIENGVYNVKCAGMPERCKRLLIDSMTQNLSDDYNEEEKEFVSKKRELTDFCVGLKVPSKLMPKQIAGGTILVDTTYEIR